jgi:cytoskeletal protein RodZ
MNNTLKKHEQEFSMKHTHFNSSRIVKRTLVILPSAALVVGFAFAQSAPPPPQQPSPSPQQPSAQTTPAASPAITASTTTAAAAPTPQPATSQPVASPQPPKKETRSGKRDLSTYDKATPITLAKNASKLQRETAVAGLRGFIFAHWQTKRHGYAQASLPNPEGKATAHSFFVEPDANGEWSVTLETSTGATETFHVVEQIEAPDDGPPIIGHGNHRIKGSTHIGLHLKQSATANSGLIL